VSAYAVQVVDTTGCGDNHCAGFIAGLNADWDLEKAARLANAAAGLVATGLGSEAGIVDLEQTIEMMENFPRLP
jgi:sugar/nucleoside kinase (ribokinase family)